MGVHFGRIMLTRLLFEGDAMSNACLSRPHHIQSSASTVSLLCFSLTEWEQARASAPRSNLNPQNNADDDSNFEPEASKGLKWV